MSAYRVIRDSLGRCTACGPNDSNFDPMVPPGGSVELSDVWVDIAPSPEQQRLSSIDDSIRTNTLGTVAPKTVAELKAMSVSEWSAWFDLNFTTAALLIGFVKRLGLIVIRRVL